MLILSLRDNKITCYLRSFHCIVLILSVFLVACSTEKDAWLNRTFHNTTAHYNGYWNAKEIIKESMRGFESDYSENYDEIIPVFIYPNEEESKAFYSPMDTAAAKCDKVIEKHSMPSKKTGRYRRTEWCAWIDENWHVVGETRFYKRSYKDAQKIFKYVEKQYPKESVVYEARLWQAKVHIETENYAEAKRVLDKLLEDQEDLKEAKEKPKEKKKKKKSSYSKKRRKKSKKKKDEETGPPSFPKNFERQIWPVYADLYLRNGDFLEAKEALEKSIELVKKRSFKTRLIFILAQLDHKLGQGEASELYALVVKRNPKYDMAFNAKINKALSFSGGNSKKIKAELLKMLKDEKNKEYHDQIYYTLGEIELSENNMPEGIAYLEKSVQSSTSNSTQKSKSFLRLAKLFYEQKEFVKAQQYYDSTLTALSKDHPEFDNITVINKSLTELVKNLNLVQRQDSLLSFCMLSEKEREKKIFNIIDDAQARLEKKEEDRKNAALIASVGNNTGGRGVFWAFDPNLRSSGFNEFRQFWGPRENEDNWRRQNKSTSTTSEVENPTEVEVNPILTVEYYTKNLPCGDEEKELHAKEDVIAGLYNAGGIYKNQLDDSEAAQKMFERLQPYLPHKKAVAGLYQLYLLHQFKNATTEVAKYKSQIVNDYPDSEYAKIIINPNYKQTEKLATAEENKDYNAIYTLFTTEQYRATIERCEEKIKDKTNIYYCKYLYIRALSIGFSNTNPEDLSEVEAALQLVINDCNDEAINEQAKLSLEKLRNKQSVDDAKSGKGTYVYDPEAKHFFILVFPNDAGSVNKAKTKVANFNNASFSSRSLDITSSFIDENNQIITTKSFANKAEAMDYYVAFRVDKKQVKTLNKDFTYFVITDKNFAALFVEKTVSEYVDFFEKNYK